MERRPVRGPITVTKHCHKRFQERFERTAPKKRVENVAKQAQPLRRRLRRRIDRFRREAGLKKVEWKRGYEYYASPYRRAIWVVRREKGEAVILTVWMYET